MNGSAPDAGPGPTADLSESLRRLFARTASGIKLGLEPVEALLQEWGAPQHAFASIHIAGTNGKGSVAAMLDAVLRAAGYRTGLYTSPHLVRFNERVRVDGVCVADDELAQLLECAERHEAAVSGRPGLRKSTFFELTTAMAFEHFRQKGVEVAVLETGLGGRLDATNVVTPRVCVLTQIGLDHTGYLGEAQASVAAEKCGIIKQGIPVVSAPQVLEVRAVIEQTAHERGARLVWSEEAVAIQRKAVSYEGQRIKVETPSLSCPPLTLPLLGRHQISNCATAVAVLEELGQHGFEVTGKAMVEGLSSVAWPARFESLAHDPRVVLDGAHNPGGAAALVSTLDDIGETRPLGLVFAVSGDKDAYRILRTLAPRVASSWIASADHPRLMSPTDLLKVARSAGLSPSVLPLSEAVSAARAWARATNGVVCIAGSVYLAGLVKEQGLPADSA